MNMPISPKKFENYANKKSAWLELTNKCNLECVHCYANSSPFEPMNNGMQKNDWIDAIDILKKDGYNGLQFIGGEPMIHPNIQDLIDHSISIDFDYIEVCTNGMHFSEKWISYFKKNKIAASISYYSSDPLIHNEITNNKNSYIKTTDGIKELVANGIDVRVSIISMDENAASVSETIKHLREIGVNKIGVDKIRKIGRGKKDLRQTEKNVISQLCGACGSNKISIDSAGDIFPCVFSHKFKLGNIKEISSLEDLAEPIASFLNEASFNVNAHCLPMPGSCGPDVPDHCGPEGTCHDKTFAET